MSESPKNSADIPNTKRGRIAAVLALCGALAGGCSMERGLDERCRSDGYDGASQKTKDNWDKIKTEEKDKGNDVNNILLGIQGREICFGYRKFNKGTKVECEGRVGNCIGKKKEK